MRKLPSVLTPIQICAILCVGCRSEDRVSSLSSAPLEGGPATVLYAAPLGAGRVCTLRDPCSLEGARDGVRALPVSQKDNVVVYLLDGTYRLTSSFALDERDAGDNGHWVSYRAAPGAKPILDGGSDLSGGWVLHDPALGIYRKTGVGGSFRQLYIDGRRGIRARYPNLEETQQLTYRGPYFSTTDGSHPFTISAANVGSWANDGAVEFVWLSHWKHNRGRIDSATVSGGTATITLKEPEASAAPLHQFEQSPAHFFFENSYALLDAPGEWFHDAAGTTLYYRPRSGENMSSVEVVAPRLDSLITVTGSETKRVSNLKFAGLTLRHGNYTLPSQCGFVSWQAANQNVACAQGGRDGAIPGMVVLRSTSSVWFDEIVVERGGAHGLVTLTPTDHTTVARSTFSDLAGGGIWVGEDQQASSSDGDVIRDNTVSDIGLDYTEAVGIAAGRVLNMTIEHNEVRNAPYTGISIGWNWSDQEEGQ